MRSRHKKDKKHGCYGCFFKKRPKKHTISNSEPAVPVQLSEFSLQYGVPGEKHEYPAWQRFSQDLPMHLSQQSFRRMISEIREMFGITDQGSLIASEYYDQHASDVHTHTPININATRDELLIWHERNIITLLKEIKANAAELEIDIGALREFEKHFGQVMDAINELHEKHNMTPRYDTKSLRDMAMGRLTWWIDSIDEEMQKDLIEARRTHSRPK